MKLSSSEVDSRMRAKISHGKEEVSRNTSEDGMGKEAWVESGGERRERKTILGDCEIHRKWDFPGGPMAKTPHSQCRESRFIPGWQTRSHMLQIKFLSAKTKAQHSQTNKNLKERKRNTWKRLERW